MKNRQNKGFVRVQQLFSSPQYTKEVLSVFENSTQITPKRLIYSSLTKASLNCQARSEGWCWPGLQQAEVEKADAVEFALLLETFAFAVLCQLLGCHWVALTCKCIDLYKQMNSNN